MKFGLKAQELIVEILRRNGTEVEKATRVEDRILKIDFWVRLNKYWIPVQFSIDKDAIVSWKGVEALRCGIVPMWINGQELEVAYSNGNGIGIVNEFWTRVEGVLQNFPQVKRFPAPHCSTQTI